MDPASITALLSGGSSLLGGLTSMFGGDGGASDAINKALDQAKQQYQQSDQATTTAARRNLALQDPNYQQSYRANQAYLAALGLPYITNDPVLASMQHNADNYIAVGPDGTQSVVNTIPGYTGGNTPRPINGAQQGGGAQGGGMSVNPFGVVTQQQGGTQGGGQAGANGLNFGAPKGTPIGTINGVTYYKRDEDSLMPYNWAAGTGFQQTPGYQFQFDQGINAINRQGAATGRLDSGAQAKELTRYGQGVANQEYNNWLNRVAGVAGQSQTATSNLGSVYNNQGTQSAANSGNLANLALTGGSTAYDMAQRSKSSFNNGLSSIAKGLGSLIPSNSGSNSLNNIIGMSQNISQFGLGLTR
jgi:hypothetical protein